MCLKLQLCAGSVRMRLNCMQNKMQTQNYYCKIPFNKTEAKNNKYAFIQNVIVPNSLW